jgi:hypothetical protein
VNTYTTTQTHTVAADGANREPDALASPNARPPTAPPYYLGRPAQVWLAAFRARRPRPAGEA